MRYAGVLMCVLHSFLSFLLPSLSLYVSNCKSIMSQVIFN
jgi:hypothetical protein